MASLEAQRATGHAVLRSSVSRGGRVWREGVGVLLQRAEARRVDPNPNPSPSPSPSPNQGNSVAGYGTHTPNYWKVQKFGGPSNCTASNQYCFVCEPRSEQTSLDLSFAIYPEPAKASTWQAANPNSNPDPDPDPDPNPNLTRRRRRTSRSGRRAHRRLLGTPSCYPARSTLTRRPTSLQP